MRFGETPDLAKCPIIGLVVVFADLSDAASCTAWYVGLNLRGVETVAVT